MENKGEIILYQSEDGTVKIDVRLEMKLYEYTSFFRKVEIGAKCTFINSLVAIIEVFITCFSYDFL